MISQLDNGLWRSIFLANDSLKREDLARSFTMTWDNPTTVRYCALGIFQLKSKKKNLGRFVLVKSCYQKQEGSRYSFNTIYFFSFADNVHNALLDFLSYLEEEEKEWLNIHLFLRKHLAFQG